MKVRSKSEVIRVDFQKRVVFSALAAAACAICASGLFFSIYSVCQNVYIRVLNVQIPGIAFGLTVLYLGIRYFLSLLELKKELYKQTSRFSWKNFKRK